MTAPLTPLDPDEQPEAPSPSPTITLYTRCNENDAPQNFDGGRLVFGVFQVATPEGVSASDVNGGNVVISAAHDRFLVKWPWKTRAAKQGRVFKWTCEEVDPASLPVVAPPLTPEQQKIADLEAEVAKLHAANGGQ